VTREEIRQCALEWPGDDIDPIKFAVAMVRRHNDECAKITEAQCLENKKPCVFCRTIAGAIMERKP
jgi:hypothetical protein